MSSAGRCIARSTSSGMVVGPGIARNSRPARTTIVALPCCYGGPCWHGRAGNQSASGRMRRIRLEVLRGGDRQEKLLSSGFAAAGGFGLVDRTEPARALVDLHLDLRIPAAGRLVIDALAGAVDVALDGAVGRGSDRSRSRRQQDRMGIGGWFGGPENHGLLVADAPVPRRDEGALPHAGLGVARGLFVGVVIMGNPNIGQRPSALHHPFLDVLAVDLAPRHLSAAAVGRAHVTGPGLVVGVLDAVSYTHLTLPTKR